MSCKITQIVFSKVNNELQGMALVARLKVEQRAADEVKKAVMKDEAEAKVK